MSIVNKEEEKIHERPVDIMYTLYGFSNTKRTILGFWFKILSIVWILVSITLMSYFYYMEHNDIYGVFLGVFIILGIIIFKVGKSYTKFTPYDKLYKLYIKKAGIRQILEKEFSVASNIENAVWIGQNYIFVKMEEQFGVFVIHDIKCIYTMDLKYKGGTRCNLVGEVENDNIFTTGRGKGSFIVELEKFNAIHVINRLTSLNKEHGG